MAHYKYKFACLPNATYIKREKKRTMTKMFNDLNKI